MFKKFFHNFISNNFYKTIIKVPIAIKLIPNKDFIGELLPSKEVGASYEVGTSTRRKIRSEI